MGVVVALSVASTIVDVSPFSTNGALVLANAQDVDKDRFYKQILGYATIVVVVGPLLAWLVFVVVPAILLILGAEHPTCPDHWTASSSST